MASLRGEAPGEVEVFRSDERQGLPADVTGAVTAWVQSCLLS